MGIELDISINLSKRNCNWAKLLLPDALKNFQFIMDREKILAQEHQDIFTKYYGTKNAVD